MQATEEIIEMTIQQAREKVELQAAFARLIQNPDYKLVIEERYFREEAVRLVQAKAHPSLQTEEHQTGILKSIDAIGQFRQFMIAINAEGEKSKQAIREAEEELDRLRSEDFTDNV